MQEPDARSEPGPEAAPAEIQADIDRTRTELGDTAEALAAKLDVHARVQEKVEQTRQQVADTTEPVRRNAVPIAVTAVGAVLLLTLVRRRRRRRHPTDR